MDYFKEMSFHADTPGSYRRPPHLLEARAKKEKGEITSKQLQDIEDAAIKVLVEKQIAAGLKVITDGEFRREDFMRDFLLGLQGVVYSKSDLLKNAYKDPEIKKEGWQIPDQYLEFTAYPQAVGKVKANPNHPEYRGFEYLKSITPPGIIPKIVVPSPNYITHQGFALASVYHSNEELYADISQAYLDTFLAFYERGARVIQIDEPWIFIYPYLASFDNTERFAIFQDYVKVFVQILKPVFEKVPKDLQLAIHYCRGNALAHYKVPFTYNDLLPSAAPLNPAYLLLEWDDERAGNLDQLKSWAASMPKTRIFIGLITTKNDVCEDEAVITAKIHEAAKYAPLDNLGITPQCGFGTMKEGNPQVTEETQWKKVNLLGTLGKKIWGDK